MIRSHARRAFTLIELLVVIAIISVLIGILMPALSRARREGYTTKCASNLRQLGMGWQLYAQDHDGAVVPGRPGKFADGTRNIYWVGNGYQFRPRWFVQMGAANSFFAFTRPSPLQDDDNKLLVDGNQVFVCPQEAERVNNRNYTYGYNYQFLGNARFLGNAEANGYINHPVQATKLASSDTLLAADTLGTAAGKATVDRTGYQVDGSGNVFAVGNHGWSLDPPRLPPGSDFCDDNNRTPDNRSAPELRHNDKTNAVFADGHVDRHDYESLGYVRNADGSIAAEAPGATNRLFSGTGRDENPPQIAGAPTP